MVNNLEFGVDWYPEQWDKSIWKDDVRRISESGFTVVRIMDFAWTVIEPKPGQFDFSLFDSAISVLAEKGISIILCTPTATPPWYLISDEMGNSDSSSSAEEIPIKDRVLRVCSSGQKHDFGSRRNCCYNAPRYIESSYKVVEAIAKHYGNDNRISGFQIDNELGHEASDRCICPHCVAKWHTWLENKYKTIDKLNHNWGTVFWNTTYTQFNQVPVPALPMSTHHNPALLIDYDKFCSDSASAYVCGQIEILKKHISADKFITTNLFPPPLSNAIDMEQMTKEMDFASWDNYPVWGDQDEPMVWQFNALAQAFVRGLHDNKPITIMEEMSGFQGHTCLGYLPPEKRLALWSVQAISRGANRIVFFRWRTAAFGQEQICYGLIDTDNEDTERLRVLRKEMKAMKSKLSNIASVKIDSPACCCYSKDNGRLLREQYLSKGLYMKVSDFVQAGVDKEMAMWYAPFITLGVGSDVMSTDSVDLNKYKIISLPLYQMADPAFVDKVSTWVKNGGNLILGYRAGTRDTKNWNVDMPLPGLFRQMAGIRIPRFESLNLGSGKLRIGLIPGKGNVWADIIEPESAEVIAKWADPKKFYSGHAAVTKNNYGKGKVWYIGTSPDAISMIVIYQKILKEAGLDPKFYGADVEVVSRKNEEGKEKTIILNHSAKSRRVKGVKLPPWGWDVL